MVSQLSDQAVTDTQKKEYGWVREIKDEDLSHLGHLRITKVFSAQLSEKKTHRGSSKT